MGGKKVIKVLKATMIICLFLILITIIRILYYFITAGQGPDAFETAAKIVYCIRAFGIEVLILAIIYTLKEIHHRKHDEHESDKGE
jgi:hypothetical protein